MRSRSLTAVLAGLLLIGASALAGCTPSTPVEAPQQTELDAAIATATTAVSNASTLVFSIKQEIPGAPSNDDLEQLQSTLNLAATQTGDEQEATAQLALDQFDAGIEKTAEAYNAAPEGSPQQDQLKQLIDVLAVGRDALYAAL